MCSAHVKCSVGIHTELSPGDLFILQFMPEETLLESALLRTPAAIRSAVTQFILTCRIPAIVKDPRLESGAVDTTEIYLHEAWRNH